MGGYDPALRSSEIGSEKIVAVPDPKDFVFPLRAGDGSTQVKGSTLALKPRADFTRSPNKGYQ